MAQRLRFQMLSTGQKPEQLRTNIMKTYILTAVIAAFSFSCEQSSTTVNPTVEKEKETTIIKEAAPTTTEKKTETETKVTPGGVTTEKTETTEKR